MKTISKNIPGLIILLILCLIACKKGALEIKKDKTYNQANAPRPLTPGVNTGTSLTLKPKGKATIIPSGDIAYVGTYRIRDKKLTVNVPDLNQEFTYTIISETRLDGEGGEVLFLVE